MHQRLPLKGEEMWNDWTLKETPKVVEATDLLQCNKHFRQMPSDQTQRNTLRKKGKLTSLPFVATLQTGGQRANSVTPP